ncbi:MAG: hypothetical protein HOP18_18570 [Deltaproteobacteria bacterium]|nr:hypothetical protein [Deltaproteobacteria bacterium]
MMTSTVTNQSCTLVSFRVNSGETRHLPPHDAITVMTVEIAENEKIRKLEELGFILIQQDMAAAQEPDRTPEKTKKDRGQQPKQNEARKKE